MLRVATAEEMRRADRRATEELAIPSLLLMENAGRGAVEVMEAVFGPLAGRRVAVLCGKGSNGGDGFVAARHLATRGARVEVFLLAPATEVRGDAGVNLAVLRRSGLAPREVTTSETLAAIRGSVAHADLIVDALLGTGLSGPATGLLAEAIELVNASARPVVSLDLPSGLSSDQGGLLGPVVQATLTVTFGLPKRGLLLYPGAIRAGRVEVVDLGIPASLVGEGIAVGLLEAADVRAAFPPRPPNAHKGSYGHLLVLAGSVGKTGAAVMASLAALRVGTGLVTLGVPSSQQPIVAAQLMEGMTAPLPETPGRTLGAKARERIVELAARMDAIAVGPGLGLEPETQALVRDLVRDLERPMVVDADGLTALAGHLSVLKEARGPRLLTPHPGELARMLGSTVEAVEADRIGVVQRLAGESGVWVALKGARTVIGGPDGQVSLNPTGNPGMATGGTGDVLTGIVGGLLAQGLPPLLALQAGVYLHGLAGDLARESRGEEGMIAGDLLLAVPDAIRRLRGDGG